jgi:catechol 2,3-dioxygenase-like lactoylglutathione lyase family enzyme
MPARLVALRFDAVDPARLARFWAHALRWPGEERDDGTFVLRPGAGTGFPIEFTSGAAPKTGQNRNHLDITSESDADQRDTVADLLALGARHVDVGQAPDETHVVLADPEGNELCVLAPGNRFLAGGGRLGAVNCDGTRAVGAFWRDLLGWPLVWDQDGETAIQAPDRTGPKITWSGPPLIPRTGRNRLYLSVALDGDRTTELGRLLALGATRLDDDGVLFADPDGNELRVEPAG